jgi:transposase-like protein
MGTSDQVMVSTAPTVKRPRQMRTNEEKRRIVEETLVPGTSLASVAFKHGVNANLLFSWRRLHRRGLLEQSREPASLVPVTITSALSAFLINLARDGREEHGGRRHRAKPAVSR